MGGQVITGARNIALAEIADPNTAKLHISTVFACASIAKMFGLTGAGLAMLKCAKPEQKNKAKAIFIPAHSCVRVNRHNGAYRVTFLFVSPVLFIIHSVLTGFALVALYLFQRNQLHHGKHYRRISLQCSRWSGKDKLAHVHCDWPGSYGAVLCGVLLVYYESLM